MQSRQNVTFFSRNTNLHITNTCIFQDLLDFCFVFVCYLNHYTRIFGKQNLHDIVALDLVKVDFHTAFCIGETHFQQGSDQTTGRNIVSGQNQAFVHQFLNCKECIAEVFRILYSRHVVAHLVE